MFTRLTVWVVAWVLATLCVAHPAVAYVCGFDGRARPSCCCKATADPLAQDVARVKRRGCCEVVEWDAPAPAYSLVDQGTAPDLVAEPPGAVPGLGPPPLRSRIGPTSSARGPPRERGPPTYLRHCSFLI